MGYPFLSADKGYNFLFRVQHHAETVLIPCCYCLPKFYRHWPMHRQAHTARHQAHAFRQSICLGPRVLRNNDAELLTKPLKLGRSLLMRSGRWAIRMSSPWMEGSKPGERRATRWNNDETSQERGPVGAKHTYLLLTRSNSLMTWSVRSNVSRW